jgi:ankyrin repeat protein
MLFMENVVQSPLPIVKAIQIAIENGNLPKLKDLLASNNQGVFGFKDNQQGRAAIELAVSHEQVDILNFLVMEKKVLFDFEQTICTAVARGITSIVTWLLSYEKTLDATLPSKITLKLDEENRNTLLQVEAIPVQSSVSKTYNAYSGKTLLNIAIHHHHLTMAELLIQHGAGINSKDARGDTPLHTAVRNFNVEAVGWLLCQPGIKINATNDEKRSPLMLLQDCDTISAAQAQEIRWLIVSKSTPEDLQKMLHVAASKGDADLIKVLLAFLENPEKQLQFINRTGKKGWTALHLAAFNGHIEIIRLLLQHGADLNAKDNQKWTPIHYSVFQGSIPVLKVLLEARASIISAQDQTVATPFAMAINSKASQIAELLAENDLAEVDDNTIEWAARKGHQLYFEILLSRNNDIIYKKTKHYGWTALYYAIHFSQFKLALFLLENGAKPDIADSYKRTALHIASSCLDGTTYTSNYKEDFVSTRLLSASSSPVSKILTSDRDLWRQEKLALIETILKYVQVQPGQSSEGTALIDQKDDQGKTPLMLAVHTGQAEVIKLLLKYNPQDVEDALYWLVQNPGGLGIAMSLLQQQVFSTTVVTKTLWYLLSSKNCEEESFLSVVESLLNKGAMLGAKSLLNKGATGSQKTTLNLAIEQGKTSLFKLLIKNQPTLLEVLDNFGKTPLMLAVENNLEELVHLFLAQPKPQVDTISREGYSALHYAAVLGHISILKLLIQYHKQHNLLSVFHTKLHNPLEIACAKNQKAAVQLLLNEVNQKEILIQAFCWAAKEGHEAILASLIGLGVNIDAKTQKGETALSNACQTGRGAIVQYLLAKNAKFSTPGAKQLTPLHIAILNDHPEIALLLIEYGAEIRLKGGENSATPLRMAVKHNLCLVTKQLLLKGADVNESDSNQEASSLLHIAIQHGYTDIALLLIEHGADVQAIGGEDFAPPLHRAIQYNCYSVAEQLILEGADVNAVNIRQETPLYLTGCYGDMRFFELLLKHGANPEHSDRAGWGVLPIAIQQGHIEMVKNLLKYPVIKNMQDLRDLYGRTSLHIAICYHQLSITRVLLDSAVNFLIQDHKGFSPLEWAMRGGFPLTSEKKNVALTNSPVSPTTYEYMTGTIYDPNMQKLDGIALAIVKAVLEKYLLTGQTLTQKEQTRLFYLANAHSQTDIVRHLLEKGFTGTPQPELASMEYKDPDNSVLYPIQRATIEGSIGIMELLVAAGADVNIAFPHTPLEFAAHFNQVEAFTWLLSHQANIALYNESDGRNAIHQACIKNSIGVIQAFFEYFSASTHEKLVKMVIEKVDSGEFSPLNLAIFFNHEEIVKLLIKYGADPNQTDSEGYNSLKWAMRRDGEDRNAIFAFLVAHNAGFDYIKSSREEYEPLISMLAANFTPPYLLQNVPKELLPNNFQNLGGYLSQLISESPLPALNILSMIRDLCTIMLDHANHNPPHQQSDQAMPGMFFPAVEVSNRMRTPASEPTSTATSFSSPIQVPGGSNEAACYPSTSYWRPRHT